MNSSQILFAFSVVYPTIVYLLQDKEIRIATTYIVSTIHAIITTYLSSKILLRTNLSYKELFVYYDNEIGYTIIITIAYLLGDVLIVYFDRENFKNNKSTIIHHVFGTLGLCAIIFFNTGSIVGLFFQFTEITTPLLNMGWMYVHYNIKKDWIFKITFILMYVVYFIVRIVGSLYLYYSFIRNLHLGFFTEHYNIITVFTGLVCIQTLLTLNLMWFKKLTNKLFLSFATKDSLKKRF